MAEEFADEERVSVGLRRPGCPDPRVDIVLAEGREQLGGLGGAQPVQMDPLEGRLAAQGPEGLGEGVVLSHLGIPVRAEDQDSVPGRHAGDGAEHPQSALVGPVEVVEAESYGVTGGPGHQVLAGGVEKAEAFFVGRQGRIGQVGEKLAQVGHELGQGGAAGAKVGPHCSGSSAKAVARASAKGA